MKKVKQFLSRHWLTMVLCVGVLGLVAILYGYGVRYFLPGLSAAEVQSIQQSMTFSSIIKNPLWLPYKLATQLAYVAGFHAASYRLISGLFVLLTLYCFYNLARRWYSSRISALTTCLFAVSSSLLTIGRVATPAIMLYSWLFIIAIAAWFKDSRQKRVAPFVLLVSFALVFYTPGSVWFLTLMSLWFWKDIPKIFKHMSKGWISIGAVMALLFVLPLVYAFYKDTSLIKDWLLLPDHISVSQTLSALKDIPAAFFYRATFNPAYNLGRLPLFDAFTGTMLVLGLYAYRRRLRLERTIVYILTFVVSSLLAAINNNQLYLVFCLPFLYLLTGEGMGYLLGQWRSVFPRNPIARTVGTLFLTIAVLGACSYHLNRYYLAWVNSPETKKVYSQTLR